MNGERHPRGLTVLFLTEMWERFSFYLMLGILPLYLADSQKGGMGWSDEMAAVVVGTYTALVYFTPFIGGLIADRLLGCRKTILIGGLLMMIGHLVLAWPTEIGLYLGLGFLILGNGAFKPNISTLLGNLYPPGSKLKDAGYNIFYMGINIGAFACNFVAAFVRNSFDRSPLHITPEWELNGWHAAFATAAVGMLVGLVVFSLNYRTYAQADQRPVQGKEESLMPLWLLCLLPALVLGALSWCFADQKIIDWFSTKVLGMSNALYASPLKPPTAAFLGACLPVIFFYLHIWRGVPDAAERGRVAALLVIFAVVIVFWMTFYLSMTALVVWTRDNTSREPNAMERLITDQLDEFAENAPPDYFINAGADTPRPARDTFEVVSQKKYDELKKTHQLSVAEGKKVYVTQEMLDHIYKGTTSLTPLLAEGKHHKLVNPELFNSINAAYVILFTPLLVGLFHWLRGKGKEPSTPAKIGLGLLFTGIGSAVMLAATLATHDGAVKGSAWWLFIFYAIITVGELCLSPIGLSLVNKMSPRRLSAVMMGGWFLSTSFGGKLSGIFGEVYHKIDHGLFWVIIIAANLVFAAVIFSLLPWLNRQMAEPKHSSP
jgi:POT family proton-dependent oligopeptide transporter